MKLVTRISICNDINFHQAITFVCHDMAIIDKHVNTLRPRQNGRHFPDDIFKCIFLDENVLILIKISLKSNWQQYSIGSDNGLAPARRQAIIWTNAG